MPTDSEWTALLRRVLSDDAADGKQSPSTLAQIDRMFARVRANDLGLPLHCLEIPEEPMVERDQRLRLAHPSEHEEPSATAQFTEEQAKVLQALAEGIAAAKWIASMLKWLGGISIFIAAMLYYILASINGWHNVPPK